MSSPTGRIRPGFATASTRPPSNSKRRSGRFGLAVRGNPAPAVAIHPQVRVVVRPYGSPVPLGFLAFGIGMFLYAALNAPWVKAADAQTIGLLLASFVAPLELVATIFAFLARDTVAAATLGLFTGSWFVAGLTTMQAKPGQLDASVGYFLVAFTIVVVLLGAAATLGKPFIAVLLGVSAVRALLSAVYELGGGAGWNHVGGWLALGIFCIAMYGGIAFLLEDMLGRTVLPLGRRGGAREGVGGGLGEQLQRVPGEAGGGPPPLGGRGGPRPPNSPPRARH